MKYSNALNAVFILVIFFEVITGPLRYYLDMFSFGVLIYLPKFLMVILIATLLLKKLNIKIIFLILTLCFYLLYSLMHLPVLSVMFGFYMVIPLLFGGLYAKYCMNSEVLPKIFKYMFFVSVFGVWLDFFLYLPWQGYDQLILGIEVEGSRAWTTMGIERPAGFARLSAAASIIVGLTSIFTIFFSKNSLFKITIFFITLLTIFVTTNKSVLIAYLFIAPLYFTSLRLYFKIPSVFLAVFMGLALPIFSVMGNVSLDLKSDMDLLVLASFEDRLINTWPNVFYFLEHYTFIDQFFIKLFGLGIGGFGTPTKYFANEYIAVADNSWLYIFSMMGILGLLLMFYVSYRSILLQTSKDVGLISVGVALNLLLWIGVTTDIFETLLGMFLIGYACSLNFKDKNSRQ